MSEAEHTRIATLDEIDVSVHHTISTDLPKQITEIEVHCGFTDVLYVPAELAEAVKANTGVALESEQVQCGAAIEIVPDTCENCEAAIDRPLLVDYYGTETPACPECEALL